MNHLDQKLDRTMLLQFIMECESVGEGHWLIAPADSNVDQMFVVTGPQKRSWVIRRIENHVQMYCSDSIYAWASTVKMAYVSINYAANSIDFNYGITNDNEIMTFGIRLPCTELTVSQLKQTETLQIARAPENFETSNSAQTSGIAIPVRHAFLGEPA